MGVEGIKPCNSVITVLREMKVWQQHLHNGNAHLRSGKLSPLTVRAAVKLILRGESGALC